MPRADRLAERLARSALALTGHLSPAVAARLAAPRFSDPTARSSLRPDEEPLMRRAIRTPLPVRGKTAVAYHWGDGERPVLLMHGWRSRASRFHVLAGALIERGLSPVAFDAPGHGEAAGRGTSALEYREMAAELQRRHGRFTAVVGHSVGGLGAYLAVRDVLTTRRLATIAAPARLGDVFDSFCALAGLGERVRPVLRRRLEEGLFAGEPDVWNHCSPVHDPAAITPPVLIVHDRDDDMVPYAAAERLAAAHGDHADLLTTRGLGHRRILTDPDVTAAVVAFAAADDAACHGDGGTAHGLTA
ncbi:alpha/beta hydrolase [Streptomyces sp. RFCAC02]|uniref:alpha/beta hydrolase n=1 Tax=Streptomyces sp. RFCAC02 TaxID=2499143 RepID=UPI00143DBF5B|nr:alpha/beta hydrolase [Streptomyces sp. RFCAC02]